MNWYLSAMQKYAVFGGRARRTEYWMFVVINFIISFTLGFLEGLAGGPGVLGGIYAVAVFLPGTAVSVRRLHDTGRSGWWIFIALIPVIGTIALLVMLAMEGTPGRNQFGSSPKFATA